MKNPRNRFIAIMLFLLLDIAFYIATPIEFLRKQSIFIKVIPGSGYYLFTKEKLS